MFALEGQPFCFSGTTNPSLTYSPRETVDDVLTQARAMGLGVVRVWAFNELGSLDGSVGNVDSQRHSAGEQPVFFQYWNSRNRRVAYNEGPQGLERLDYVVARAAELDLKVILVLANNWKTLGGIDQYVQWFGLEYHHHFFSDRTARGAYKRWAQHLTERVNRFTGRAYRDEPAIFAWELANQPGCFNGGPFDATPVECNSGVVLRWAEEMAAHLKALDPNHLVAVGDAGFFAPTGTNSEEGQGSGPPAFTGDGAADHAGLLAIPDVDYATFHLYPGHWSQTPSWADRWIVKHLLAARRAGKPAVLAEYGLVVDRDAAGLARAGLEERLSAYERWNTLLLRGGASGSMFWKLAGLDASNPATGYAPDSDRLSVYNRPGERDAELLGLQANRFRAGALACKDAIKAGFSLADSRFVTVSAPPRREPPPPSQGQSPALSRLPSAAQLPLGRASTR